MKTDTLMELQESVAVLLADVNEIKKILSNGPEVDGEKIVKNGAIEAADDGEDPDTAPKIENATE